MSNQKKSYEQFLESIQTKGHGFLASLVSKTSAQEHFDSHFDSALPKAFREQSVNPELVEKLRHMASYFFHAGSLAAQNRAAQEMKTMQAPDPSGLAGFALTKGMLEFAMQETEEQIKAPPIAELLMFIKNVEHQEKTSSNYTNCTCPRCQHFKAMKEADQLKKEGKVGEAFEQLMENVYADKEPSDQEKAEIIKKMIVKKLGLNEEQAAELQVLKVSNEQLKKLYEESGQ